MNRTSSRQLPGVSFEVEPPASVDALPRMDIAAFVGLAASGPLDMPVAVEDAPRFREIFGDDPALAWDPAASRTLYANLGPAVEAFFGNGGRRCWVVRVADPAMLTTNRFELAGLIRVIEDSVADPGGDPDGDPGGPVSVAVAPARSGGSWSDALRVQPVIRPGPVLPVVAFDPRTSTYDLLAPVGGIVNGDLLRVAMPGAGLVVFVVAGSVERKAFAGTAAGLRVRGSAEHWFATAPLGGIIGSAVRAVIVGATADVELPLMPPQQETVHLVDADAGRYTVKLNLPLAEAPAIGDLLRIDLIDGTRTRALFLPVVDVVSHPQGSPPIDCVVVTGEAGLWRADRTLALALLEQASQASPPSAGATCERLLFDLVLWRSHEVVAALPNLAFDPDHPRYWGRLPLDDELFLLSDGMTTIQPSGPLAAEASSPRFPLAGPPLAPGAREPLFLPIGMRRRPDPSIARGPLGDHDAASALRRNGLAAFEAVKFIDPDLADSGAATLVSDAFDKLYLRRERLHGMHALFPLEEVSLIALPDAVQPGWSFAHIMLPPGMIAAPALSLSVTPATSTPMLSWTSSLDGAQYELQGSDDPQFAQSSLAYQGTNARLEVTDAAGCPSLRYYRVRIVRGSLVSPWSNTVALRLGGSAFERCGWHPPEAPVLSRPDGASPPEERVVLAWSAVPGAVRYVVQSAPDPEFVLPTSLATNDRAAIIPWDRTGTIFIRVRAETADGPGPWSNTVGDAPADRATLAAVVRHADDPSGLLAAHRALLRFCYASGDKVAVLTMPAHYREQECLSYLAMLTPSSADDGAIEAAEPVSATGVRPLNPDEEIVLSYGALYHPWLTVRDNRSRTGELARAIPPCGAVTGAIAARGILRGAWIAPANDPLAGVIGLRPSIARSARLPFYNAAINLVLDEPRGFLLLSADTLSADDAVRPINVRRLMILLRRLALREGMEDVFQPNNERFRRRVQHRFQELLGMLFQRGAFAGGRAESAFQVVIDESVNRPADLDAGRFTVELRVAPARPTEFITVRLVQSGAGSFTTEER